MRKYVVVGIPGSGKSTQSTMLARDFDLVRISTGDIFRWHVRHHTKIGARVRRVMTAGQLVGDVLVETIMRDRLDEHDWNYGFVIDGFPRNRRQAEFFLESYDLDAVIYLDIPDSQVRHRVLSRRLCERCGVDYSLIESRPEQEDVCDVCADSLVTREDDTPEALTARLFDYHKDIDVVLELLGRKAGVFVIDASRDQGTVHAEILSRLGLPSPPSPGGSAGMAEQGR
ncbi:adenylate kinase family protein [Sphaerisporangium perillae]|uniref:adenylate kinase family protein n=1 Tax=Sphaerisporangium perillae TaxID=2935860 RepID=UPI0020105D83|nr:nucleoside monophosphate kinase [Sphaerisporangium perillae]